MFKRQVADSAVVPDLRRQDTVNRQYSIDDMDRFIVQDFQVKTQQLYDMSQSLYNEMLQAGVAKECAREVLPMSSPTKLYMNGTLRSWMHYCELRCANGTQEEHKRIATQCKNIIRAYFPKVYGAMW